MHDVINAEMAGHHGLWTDAEIGRWLDNGATWIPVDVGKQLREERDIESAKWEIAEEISAALRDRLDAIRVEDERHCAAIQQILAEPDEDTPAEPAAPARGA